MGSFRVIRYDTIQWLEIVTVTFLCQKKRKRKCLFPCSGRGGETLKKLDALNYTNIQYKASIQSLLKISSSPGASLPWSTVIWSNTADAIHMPRTSQNKLEQHVQIIYLYNCKKIHPGNVWHATYKALILNIGYNQVFLWKTILR